ncbi:MAG: membrane protein insertase YidC [Clostridia bacterium]|nr:membrane protein insertase YidC [Clostridia bacterium]
MFDFLNKPIGWIIKICYSVTNSYVGALVLFTLALQILLLPFAIKQQKNSIKQAKLDPKVRAIRKKYAGRNDQATQQKIQNETMELYQREKFNPMGGCLPILIQMPILVAIYGVVTKPLTYICNLGTSALDILKSKTYELLSTGEAFVEKFATQADFSKIYEIDLVRYMREAKIENYDGLDLGNGVVFNESMVPDFSLFGLDLSYSPAGALSEGIYSLLLITVFTLIFTFLSQWITRKVSYNPNAGQQADKSMKIMQWTMPLLSVYIAHTVAGAVGLYWIIRNIFTTIQTVVLAKVMPIPRFTEEDYKAAEREMNVKETKKKSSNNNSGKKSNVRSLHHIDDDDDEEAVATVKSEKTEPKKVAISEDAPKLKDESDRHKKDDKKEETKTEETNEEA